MLWYVAPYSVLGAPTLMRDLSAQQLSKSSGTCVEPDWLPPAFFYFYFRDSAKQDVGSLLSSLLVQFSNLSDNFCATLSRFYLSHDRGSQKPSEDAIIYCPKDVLKLRNRGNIHRSRCAQWVPESVRMSYSTGRRPRDHGRTCRFMPPTSTFLYHEPS